MAILLSSHLLNQVQSVCDRIGIFAAGRLIGQGTMADLAAPVRRRHGPRRGRVPDRRRRRRRPASARSSRRSPARPTSRAPRRGHPAWSISVRPASERDPRPAGGHRGRGLDRARPDLDPVARAVARGDLPAGRRARRPRPREGRPMTADSTPLPAGSSRPPMRRPRRRPRGAGRGAGPTTARSRRAASDPCRTPAGWSSPARSSPTTSGRPGSSSC